MICKAIVFDMDDTLYPEADYVLSGFNAVALWFEKERGIPKHKSFDNLAQLFYSGVRGNTFNLWLEQQSIPYDKVLIQECLKVYRDHDPKIKPFECVIPLLKQLKKRYKIGLLSDGYLSVQQRKFKALKLSSYFDGVVFSDEWGREAWKPSLTPFKHILKRLDIESDEAVYIGDNPSKDFLGANKLGFYTIWIRRVDGEYNSLSPTSVESTSDITIGDLSELQNILLS